MTKSKTGPWVVEPPSKTAICTVTYPLPSTRPIHAVAITVNSGDGTDRSPILSRRLRLQAIQQFCSAKMALIEHYAVQLWADKISGDGRLVPIDHVLVVSESSATAIPKIITHCRGVEYRVGVTKQVRSFDGNASTQPIYCQIESDKTITAHSNLTDYWQKLNILLCQHLGAANLGPNALYIKPDSRLFDAIRVTGPSSKVPKQLLTALDAVKSNMAIEQAPGVKVLFQMKMILDP